LTRSNRKQPNNGDVEPFCHGGLTVSDFVVINTMVINANGNTSNNSRRMLPAKIDTTIYYQVGSDISEVASRQLIRHISQLESERVCLADLNADNVRLSPTGTNTTRG